MSEAPPGTPDPSDGIIRDLKRKVAKLEAELDRHKTLMIAAADETSKLFNKYQAASADKARLSEALRAIVARSHNDPLGTSKVNDMRNIATAALSGSGPGWPVPDGWKLVPVEPDDAMIEAGQDTCEEKNSWGGRVYASDIWESMLAASPAAPQRGGE